MVLYKIKNTKKIQKIQKNVSIINTCGVRRAACGVRFTTYLCLFAMMPCLRIAHPCCRTS